MIVLMHTMALRPGHLPDLPDAVRVWSVCVLDLHADLPAVCIHSGVSGGMNLAAVRLMAGLLNMPKS